MSPELTAVILVLWTLCTGLLVIASANLVADAEESSDYVLAATMVSIAAIALIGLVVLMSWLLF